ncbi:hypothetical protein [Winogradskyella luteola]|uniref:Uncharacterized protein n=1 Tax=Winogradskyella luteola TaxID=2828330 RepID=A0A9X1FAM7_9FLAO|nr:hypothetical protein [Winogradskyella luteola]MBV7270346.1 hypothetical protein [Winogradskyella luteola]
MIRRLFICFCFLSLITCDDGDIITVDLEFDQVLDLCTNNTESFLIYDLREDPNESLSLIIPRANNQDFPYTEPTPVDMPTELTINGSSIRFIYRTYNRAVEDGELCDPIPPANLNIVEDYEADSGTVYVTVTIEDDDGDGIPSDLENRGEMDENGDYPNAQDWDNDGIPDYQDEDDDNDNVPTSLEIDTDDLDGDGDPTTNPLNTDGDEDPDYLDEDDDNDGVDTRLEDDSGEKNPRASINEVVDTEGMDVYRYLYSEADDSFADLGVTDDNEYTRSVTVNFMVTGINLQILSSEQIDLGTLIYSFDVEQE